MNPSSGCAYPPVFVVDGHGPQPPMPNPGLVPCWTFPPAVVKRKKKGCDEACVVTVVALILFLILAALGYGTYQILKLQTELRQLRKEMATQQEGPSPQRQTGPQEVEIDKKETRQAAHLIARIEKPPSSLKTLHWEPSHGRAFTSGVEYRDGGLRINETGLYYVYSRVQFQDKRCTLKDSLSHTVFRKREGDKPLVLLEGHRMGFCRSEGKEHQWSSSSQLGAVLELRSQDWVFVNVSHPMQLSYDHNANYFGLYKL
ncbi:hypothetical protein JZ751_024844 [Albula glossodonta]|uniref:Tumor necrosis factor ligand superfamily member 6 n=1 Tax=Albula glossodonta TaxID=121402 RepID=A0A8T2PEK1_9TELE|nr:hypothetical protein JZ751_024844 [Albula glossodonta]